MVEQLAALDPPRSGCSALDAPLPVGEVSPDLPAGRLVAESAAGLAAALEGEIRSNTLHLYASWLRQQAEFVARHAAAVAAASQATSGRQPWEQAPAAWRVTQAALIRFDDGSRYGSTPPSAVTRWAMHLTDATERLANILRSAGPADLDELTVVTWSAAGRLPIALAGRAGHAYRWVGDGKLFARARALPQSARHVRAVVRDEVVIATPHDLSDVVASARTAAPLGGAGHRARAVDHNPARVSARSRRRTASRPTATSLSCAGLPAQVC